MNYRTEIDGLRAIAVVPVVFFHAGFDMFSGGYVGVDVFFVISGYLITSILISDIKRKEFSFSSFYERRASRILPALFVVMAACLLPSYFWMTPAELKEFASSLLATVFFSSNILFWRQAGYFSANAELKPLLHTWSLSVEEQFYIIFPIFLMVVWRFGQRGAFAAVLAVAFCSFLMAEWGSYNKPSAAFYLAPTRAWELLAGSICAFLMFGKGQRSSNAISIVGLALIIFPILFYDKNTPSPSVYTIIPVLGTAFIIIFASKETYVARLLSTRIFVGVGLISYSAYLWHQPLFAFARLRSLTEVDQIVIYALAFLSFALAWVTWRWVERPFRVRRNSLLATRTRVFVAGGAISSVFIVTALIVHVGNGFNWRSNEIAPSSKLEDRILANHGMHPDCDGSFNNSTTCSTSDTPNFLLWGDSFAMHIMEGILANGARPSIRQHTMSACAPIIGIAIAGETRNTQRSSLNCIEFNNRVLDWLTHNKQVNIVIISSALQILNHRLIDDRGRVFYGEQEDFIFQMFLDTISAIRSTGAKVVVVSPTPGSGWNIGRCLAKATFLGLPRSLCSFRLNLPSPATEFLRRVERHVPIYWIHDDICREGVCHAEVDGHFIYNDAAHLSREGSRHLGEINAWTQRFREMAR